MAEKDERVNWEKFLPSVRPTREGRGKNAPPAPAPSVPGVSPDAPVSEDMEYWVGLTLCLNVAVLWFFLMTWAEEGGWVSRSLFFQILGCAFVFTFLCLAWLCGQVLWLIGDNRVLAAWAYRNLPSGALPERVMAGAFVACVVVGVLLGALMSRRVRSRRDAWMWLAAMVVSLLVLLVWTIARVHPPIELAGEGGVQ